MWRTLRLLSGWRSNHRLFVKESRDRRPVLVVGLVSGIFALLVFIIVAAVGIGGGASNQREGTHWSERSADATADSEPRVRYVPYNGLANQQSDHDSSAVRRSDDSEQHRAVVRNLSEVLRDRYDESDLRYGSDGSEGSILPLDNGVVPSSGARFHTPWELILPSAGIRAAVVQVGLTPDGAMGSPDNPFVVGWFNRSANPGELGNALLGGHRDYQDRDGNIDVGVCWKLDETRIGDQLILFNQSANRYYVYDIVDKATILPDSEEAVRYLSQTRESVVTLITCSGDFDKETHSYAERLIVVALLNAVAAPDA
ncbi:MAG: class F sortase [Chloroflexota bacterium]|nr:class F sortase [Chloroflexota bacterium]MDE2895111.1 class F sortase [Chloroflexota bacterium]